MGLIISLCVGALAGWLAGNIMKGSGLGTIGNIIVGIIGGVIGGYVLGALGVHFAGLIGSIITATLGAVLLLWIVGLVKKKA